jgi:hypothetical protein
LIVLLAIALLRSQISPEASSNAISTPYTTKRMRQFSKIYAKNPSKCSGGINAMVEGSKFKESHILKILSWRTKKGGMPRPFSIVSPKHSGLASFCTCFRYPVSGRSCRYASRHTKVAFCKLTKANETNAAKASIAEYRAESLKEAL